MRLVEQLIEEDSGDFTVEADTPALAAAILLQAHDAAREADRNLVTLPDGQSRNIEPDDVVGNRVFCILLNEAADEIGGEIEPDYRTPPAQHRQEDTPGLCTDSPAASIEVIP